MNLQYDIFISYRHTERDRAWAKWLLESLETYKVPKSLQKKGFPARIGKAFRDEDELPTSSDLSTNIQQALEGSKFLVVICSKDTPSSLWVDKEVQTFRKLGKGDHIIPLLVEGTPETSFPPSLLTLKKPVKQADGTVIETNEPLEPIAADVRPRTDEKESTLKRLALLRILSAILGCAFDDLRQRDQERQARKKRIQYTVVAICSLLIVGGSLYLWDYNRIKVSYYNTIVYRWGVPEGVGRLSEEAFGRRNLSYRLERQRRMTVRVLRLNSSGMLKDNDDQEAEWLVQYRNDGLVDRIVCRDHNGRFRVMRKIGFAGRRGSGADTMIVEFTNEMLIPRHQGEAGDEFFIKKKTDITRHLEVLNTDGYSVRVLYQNQYGVPKPDLFGSYGIETAVDADGLPVKRAELSIEGAPVRCKQGFVWLINRYDGMGNVAEETYASADMAPVSCVDGYAMQRFTFDRWGNRVGRSFFDIGGHPVRGPGGFAQSLSKFDNQGRWTEQEYADENGRLTMIKGGYAKIAYQCDGHGNIIEIRYLGAAGEPVGSRLWGHREVAAYDSAGNAVSKSTFGVDGKQALNAYGYASETFRYGRLGLLEEIAYYGTGGESIDLPYGFSRETRSYDANGRIVVWSLADAAGRPARHRNGLPARTEIVYDEKGRWTQVSFFDAPGVPTAIAGYHCVKVKYDENSRVVGETYWAADGSAALGEDGCASRAFEYDPRGNIARDACYGTRGEPVINKDEGYASRAMQYDPMGRLTTQTFYGVDGKQINGREGFSRMQIDYSSAAPETLWYDKSGKVVKAKAK